MPFDHFYAVVEYVILTLMYSKILQNSVRKVIITLMPFMCAFALYNTLYLQGINSFPSNFVLICELFYMCYAFLGFKKILLHPLPIPLHQQGLFWLNLAQIIFSTTLFIYFGLMNYLNSHHSFGSSLVIFVQAINLIYALLLSTAILNDANSAKYLELNGQYK